MDDLSTWLRAQIDDDERIARAVRDNSAPWDGQWKPDSEHAVRTYNGWVLAYGHDGRPLPPGFAAHVARHDPARVLADVAAKRRIIELILDDKDGVACANRLVDGEYDDDMDLPGRLLRLLALPFADRVGYREEWRP